MGNDSFAAHGDEAFSFAGWLAGLGLGNDMDDEGRSKMNSKPPCKNLTWPRKGKDAVRLRDIAEQLNLSPSTVSRALAGNRLISAETRELVQRMALSMEYVAPSHGVRKHRGATRTVGISISSEDLHDRSMTQLLQHLHCGMLELGYHVMVILDPMNSAADAGRLATLRPVIDEYLDGMILCSATTDSTVLRELRRLGIPVVLAGRSVEGSEVDTVEADSHRSSVEMARHCWELGHRRIGVIVGAMDSSTSHDRVRGVLDFMGDVGADRDSVVVAWGTSRFRDAHLHALEMLSGADRVTAILGGSDSIVMAVLEAARLKRLVVPDDLSVAGFGDVPLYGTRLIALTAISSPVKEIARTVCHRMVERIRTGGLTPPKHDVVPTRLVLRSTSVPPLRREQWRVSAL